MLSLSLARDSSLRTWGTRFNRTTGPRSSGTSSNPMRSLRAPQSVRRFHWLWSRRGWSQKQCASRTRPNWCYSATIRMPFTVNCFGRTWARSEEPHCSRRRRIWSLRLLWTDSRNEFSILTNRLIWTSESCLNRLASSHPKSLTQICFFRFLS